MKETCRPNRNITQGDRGAADLRAIQDIKARMTDWGDDFIKKIYFDPRSPLWFQAAKETLNERRVPRQEIPKCPQPQGQKKKNRWREKLTKSERRAIQESKRLDAQFKNIN